MEIIQVTKENTALYLDGIAKVHMSAYSHGHFTSTFNHEKLKEYNRLLLDNSDISLVAVEDGRVVGFMISGEAVSRGVKEFTRQNRLYLIYKLLLRPDFLAAKAFGKLKSMASQSGPVTRYRLLSIATDASAQSTGVGRQILAALEDKLRERGLDSYGLSVRLDNPRAVQFYQRNGFMVEREQPGALYFRKDLR
ncbi:GNAT family N-acetyltransferase [Pseudaminobacter arsenicus]|uniref:GNAT family N-acetyltransferase n=2 Tax=Borborobacter arsenicus TaxID=1851146 RepID=A0A432V9N3_9HYPH|nr:GNAT family N-acetyltransferase [Pseudaminobacter arsenicus]